MILDDGTGIFWHVVGLLNRDAQVAERQADTRLQLIGDPISDCRAGDHGTRRRALGLPDHPLSGDYGLRQLFLSVALGLSRPASAITVFIGGAQSRSLTGGRLPGTRTRVNRVAPEDSKSPRTTVSQLQYWLSQAQLEGFAVSDMERTLAGDGHAIGGRIDGELGS